MMNGLIQDLLEGLAQDYLIVMSTDFHNEEEMNNYCRTSHAKHVIPLKVANMREEGKCICWKAR